MLRRLTLLATGAILLAVLPVQARGAPAHHSYGRGTHAFFSGEFLKAYGLLTTAIGEQPDDPRAYHFRGLAYLKLGRPEEARLDFKKGAELEMADSNAFYNVSKALVRIQGKTRLAIEQFRADARAAAMKRAEARLQARFETLRRQEDRVLRKNVVLTPQPTDAEKKAEAIPSGRGIVQPKPTEPPDVNPFEKPSTTPEVTQPAFQESKEAPAAKKAPAKEEKGGPVEDSFAETKKPPVKKAPAKEEKGGPVEDPFAETKKPSVKKAPAKEEKGGLVEDPFAIPKPVAAPEPPPAKKAPAKEEKGGPVEDPFAETKKPPVKKAPAKPAGGGAEDDPFDNNSLGAVRRPAIEAPSKATGPTPVTKPVTDVNPVTPVSRRVEPQAAKATSKTSSQAGASTDNPDDGNPFIDEPVSGPEQKAPAKEAER